MRLSLSGLISVAVLALAVGGHSAHAGPDAPDSALWIEAQPLSKALLDFSAQTGLQIGYVAALANGKVSRKIEGIRDPGVALDQLLANTGLEHTFVNNETVVIRAAVVGAPGGEESLPADPAGPLTANEQDAGTLSQAAALEDDEPEKEDETGKAEEPLELARQVVTGSRLGLIDPTALIISMSAEEIAARGVSDLEELLRTLPEAFSSITSQSNTALYGGLRANDTESYLGLFGLGLSSVNLRAMGSGNTLVLVDGKRIAGEGSFEQIFVNLQHIPLSAIERVEIQLDGASAVYGSDAVGGVVNIILKRNMKSRTLSASVRNELSSTGADSNRISLGGGYSWDSGAVSAAAARNTSRPIVNADTGWTSNDYRNRFGPEFDLRNYDAGQPGVVCEFNGSFRSPGCSYFDSTRYQLPAGQSGVGATIGDFIVNDVTPIDVVLPRNGADSALTSLTARIEQSVTDNLSVSADLLYSTSESMQGLSTTLPSYLVGASNAFNPFGRDVVVSYWPGREIEHGLMRRSFVEADSDVRRYGLELQWTLGNHELKLHFGRSRSERYAWSSTLERKSYGDPGADRFYAALDSSDPDQAINVFGDGSKQLGTFSDHFSLATNREGVTELTSYEPVARGRLMRMWGGEARYAAGAEYREVSVTRFQSSYSSSREGLTALASPENSIGVATPTEKSWAYFAEFSFPVIGADNARPGLRSLTLSVQARRDSYKSTGSVGRESAVEFVPNYFYVPGEGWREFLGVAVERTGPLNLEESSHSRTSPRLGLAYKPTEQATLRFSWSRSFRPPRFSDMFSVALPSSFYDFVFDEAHPSGEPRFYVSMVNFLWARPELEPEHSDNYMARFDWSPARLPALRWSAHWSLIDFTNKIENTSALLYAGDPAAWSHPAIVERGADGNATLVNHMDINLAEKVSEIVRTRLQYGFRTRAGDFELQLHYYAVLKEQYRITAESPPTVRKGTAAGSPASRLTVMLDWQWRKWAARAQLHRTPGYENDLAGGACPRAVGRCQFRGSPLPALQVESLTTVDLTLRYEFDNGLVLRAGGRNIFEATAPTIWNRLPYDPTRWDARGRVFFLEAQWQS